MEFNALRVLLLVLLRLTLLGLPVAGLLVDVDFLAVLGLGTAEMLFLGDADLLLDVGVAVVGSVDGGGEGLVGFFVTFPSVCSLLLRDLCFTFYLDAGRFLCFRVLVRRREDTEGDRDLLLLIVQLGGRGERRTRASKSSLPESGRSYLKTLRTVRKQFERNQERTSWLL